MKVQFILTFLEILLLESKLVLSATQRVNGKNGKDKVRYCFLSLHDVTVLFT